MMFKLRVISGAKSPAPYQYVSMHSTTARKFAGDYVSLSFKTKTMIVKYETCDTMPVDHVGIHPITHGSTMQITTGDDVLCQSYSQIQSTDSISVRLLKTGKLITCPTLMEPLYVMPGYRIVCPGIGMAEVVTGQGLYCGIGSGDIDVAMSQHPTTINMDFCQMGIGGLEDEMTTLIRQVLISRIITKKMRDDYEVKDIKGILLYGPPGTGKTLIARNIGKIIPNSVITKVNGPELASKFYGETEGNIRKIFDAAKSNPDKLHVIIFDEIDAIGMKRGGGGSSNIDDKALTQLLTMIDGLDSASNALIIGITNRMDVLDPALVRAGRLEFHVEIPLPDCKGRREILDIYLRPLYQKNLVNGIDSASLAQKLDGYTGADIESLIGRSKNLALLRNCDIDAASIKPRKDSDLSQMTALDIDTAISTFVPTFSKDDDVVKNYTSNYTLTSEQRHCVEAQTVDINEALMKTQAKPYVVALVDANEDTRIQACYLAIALELPHVRYVDYNSFLGKTSSQCCASLNDAYMECLQAERAVLILDSLEDVCDRSLALKQRYILNHPVKHGKQLVVITIS